MYTRSPKLLCAASSEIEYLLEAPVDLINAQKTALTFALPSIKSDPMVSLYGDRFWKDSRCSVAGVPILPIDFHGRFVSWDFAVVLFDRLFRIGSVSYGGISWVILEVICGRQNA